MSTTAHNWARDLTTLKSSTLKSILKELGSFENGQGFAWESIDTLVRFTDLNRKTVMAGLAELVKRGYLEDTGERAGQSKRTPIYAFGRLKGFVPDFVKTRQLEEEQQANSPKNGTISGEDGESPKGVLQPVENKGAVAVTTTDSDTSIEQSQKRDHPKNGTIPKTDGDSPNFGSRQSQNWASNGINCNNSSDARASAQGRARAKPAEKTEPAKRTLTDAQGGWRNYVTNQFLDVVRLERREWIVLSLDRLPVGMSQRLVREIRPLVDRCVAMELEDNFHVSHIETAIRPDCCAAAQRALAEYLEACAAAQEVA